MAAETNKTARKHEDTKFQGSWLQDSILKLYRKGS